MDLIETADRDAAPEGAAAREHAITVLLADDNLIVREGVQLEDVELRAPTLDDVFLAKTGRTLEGAAEGEDEA